MKLISLFQDIVPNIFMFQQNIFFIFGSYSSQLGCHFPINFIFLLSFLSNILFVFAFILDFLFNLFFLLLSLFVIFTS
ncbi:unnamed protein product [Meloidogyne enterolobii]|uniref:Uncharacterized protein n=2 Tax=Meloidogyne enterolobii TaxID=390850 RepID=A0A6V7XZJ7_MELEN|nr:unnamed protein product [Meloidogyne enterolobii]